MEESMATILLIGTDIPLLEGLAQTLAAASHSPRIVDGVREAMDLALADPPLVAVVDRSLAVADVSAMRVPLATGGAILLYHAHGNEGAAALAPGLQRAVLADLTLPLERHRLVALIQKVEERARDTGRGRRRAPPEQRAP
jgi:DNA-binding NtrC family response regulator